MSNNNNNAHTLRHMYARIQSLTTLYMYVYDGANKKTSTQYFWRVEAAEAQRQRRRNNTKQIIVYMCVVVKTFSVAFAAAPPPARRVVIERKEPKFVWNSQNFVMEYICTYIQYTYVYLAEKSIIYRDNIC